MLPLMRFSRAGWGGGGGVLETHIELRTVGIRGQNFEGLSAWAAQFV